MDTKALVIQEVEWGGMHLGIETYHEKVDLAPFLTGLPDNKCSLRHWGYMVKGSMRVKYNDHEEVVNAGDAYYLAPGRARANSWSLLSIFPFFCVHVDDE
jgi:hypothetical protein